MPSGLPGQRRHLLRLAGGDCRGGIVLARSGVGCLGLSQRRLLLLDGRGLSLSGRVDGRRVGKLFAQFRQPGTLVLNGEVAVSALAFIAA